MKKVTRLFGLACMVGVLAFGTSCKKKNETAMMDVTVSTPGFVVEDGDRAYITPNYQFMWEEGDQIYVYNLDATPTNSVVRTFSNISGGPKPKAIFRGPSVGRTKGSFGYRFFYPTSMCTGDEVELQEEGNHQTFMVPATQEYGFYFAAGDPDHPKMIVDPASMPMACQPATITSNVTMRQMFGLAKFGFQMDENQPEKTVSYIEVIDNAFNLNGSVSLNVAAVDDDILTDLFNEYAAGDPNFAADYTDYVIGDMEWTPNNDGDNIITLNCENANVPGVTLNETNSEWFYVLLRPLALSHGFQVKVHFTDGTTLFVNEFWNEPNLAYTMKPAVMRTFTYNYPIHEGEMVGAIWE